MSNNLAPAAALTDQQLKVVELIAAGHSTRGIALTLGISPLTARKHRENILSSLSLDSAAALAAYAARMSASRANVPRDGLIEAHLTPREKEVGAHLLEGMTNKQVGRRLGISDFTVRKHRENIYRKLSVKNIHGLIKSFIETSTSAADR